MTSTRAVLLVALCAAAVAVAVVFGVRLAQTERQVAEAPAPEPEPLRYAREYPPIAYAATRAGGPLAALERRLDDGTLALGRESARADLLRLLDALDVDAASQMLVFSKTSQTVRSITPRTPRAIYFNDDTYVAYVQDRPFEIAVMDPHLGAVFYTLERPPEAGSGLERHTYRCLRCHDSYSLSGGGVPRLMIGSGYTNTAGHLVSHEGWILTTDRTPLSSRWGGWYVTGYHGDAVHLGNIRVPDVEALQDLERLRRGNLENLDGVLDTSAYATNTSDIVALMVLAHQIHVQNVITRVHYDVETEMARRNEGEDTGGEPLEAFVAEAAEPLVRVLLFDGEAALESRIEGTSGFAGAFEARGPFDAQGRSLRELRLDGRMFEYPLSYVIYSKAFDALPEPVRRHVYGRLETLLTGELSEEPIGHLGRADRAAMYEILAATKNELAALASTAVDAEESQNETDEP